MPLKFRCEPIHRISSHLIGAIALLAVIGLSCVAEAEDDHQGSMVTSNNPQSLADELMTLKSAVDSLSKKLEESGVDVNAIYANGASYRANASMGNPQPQLPPAQGSSMPQANMMNSMMSMMNAMMGGMNSGPNMGQPILGAGNAISSSLPGFPGISHLYHVGSTNFFLDHSNHIGLSFEQQRLLSAIQSRASQHNAKGQRDLQQLEEELWILTSADQPDIKQIELKIKTIENQRSNMRLAFIRNVGEAATVLTQEQRLGIVGGTKASSQNDMQQSGKLSGTNERPNHM